MNKETNPQEVIVNVTEEEYQADLDRGLLEDEVLMPGLHRFKRGGFLARHALTSEDLVPPVKVQVALDLDLDVLNYFKQRAGQTDADSYQVQINAVLREVMEQELAAD